MPLSVDLLCVDTPLISGIWPHVEQMLKAATEQCGEWSTEQIRDELSSGLQLLWVTWDGSKINAAATTRLQKEPHGLVCQAIACGGHDDDWPARFAGIESYARNEGCVATRIQGRPGWGRIFKDYNMQWVSLEKRIV